MATAQETAERFLAEQKRQRDERAAARAEAERQAREKTARKSVTQQRKDELKRLQQTSNRTAEQNRRMRVLEDTLRVTGDLDAQVAQLDRASRATAGARRGASVNETLTRRVGVSLTRAGNTTRVKQTSDILRQQFGMGGMVTAGFLEQVRDPETDRVTGIAVPEEMTGYRFGPAQVGGGQRAGSTLSAREITMMSGMSINEVLAFYSSLNDRELAKFQTELMEAGMFADEAKVSLGLRDDYTGDALANFMKMWAANPNLSVSELLTKLKTSNANKLDIGKAMGDSDGTGVASDMVKNITFMGADEYSSILDTAAVDLFGEKLSPERKSQLIAKLQEQEKVSKTAAAQADFTATQAGTKVSEMDAFIEALIGQESGGNPEASNNFGVGHFGLGQISNTNWAPWAREAGRDPGDKSAENQRAVIRHHVAKYYAMFGNWRDVAIAWYAGEGAPGFIKRGEWSGNAPEAGPTINEYADQVTGAMNTVLGSGLAPVQPKLTVNATQALSSAETRAEEELKRLDPARYEGKKFANSANIFFGLLGGVN